MNINQIEQKTVICEGKNCCNPASQYIYPIIDSDEEELRIAYYCPDHAAEEGFCWNCGQFWGGIESYDFRLSGQPDGLCSPCWQDIKHDFTWEEETDEWGDIDPVPEHD